MRAVPAAGRAQRRLAAYEYDGFWMSMDTFKDRQQLEEIYARGNAPGRSGTRNGCRAAGLRRRRCLGDARGRRLDAAL